MKQSNHKFAQRIMNDEGGGAGFGVSLEEVIRLFASSQLQRQQQQEYQQQQQQQQKDQQQLQPHSFDHHHHHHHHHHSHSQEDISTYRIPTELLSRDMSLLSKTMHSHGSNQSSNSNPPSNNSHNSHNSNPNSNEIDNEDESMSNTTASDVDNLPRGGAWQPSGEDGLYYPDDYGVAGDMYHHYNYEQLHAQMLQDRLLQQQQQQQQQQQSSYGYASNQGYVMILCSLQYVLIYLFKSMFVYVYNIYLSHIFMT